MSNSSTTSFLVAARRPEDFTVRVTKTVVLAEETDELIRTMDDLERVAEWWTDSYGQQAYEFAKAAIERGEVVAMVTVSDNHGDEGAELLMGCDPEYREALAASRLDVHQLPEW